MQINSAYKSGSTGKIVYDIHSYLQEQGHESIVCYGRLGTFNEPNVYKTCGELEARFNRVFTRITGLKYGSCILSTHKLIRIIEKEQPNIVHLQCVNGYFVNIYKLVTYLNENKIKTVLTLHAEFMHTANCGHALKCERWKTGCGNCPRLREEIKSFFIDNTALSWKKMKRSFKGFDNLRVVSVSKWLQDRAQQSPILADKKHMTILNGIDTDVFKVNETDKIKATLNLLSEKIILHVTARFSDKEGHHKGGYYVLEMAKRFMELDSDVIFLIAGKYDGISKLPSNVVLLGNISDQKMLAKYYSMADVTLLTSKKETFSMVVAESLCCGTPVVGFTAGAPELIAINEFSSFVPQGDSEELFKEVKTFIYNREFDKDKISSVAKCKYSKKVMGQNYLNLYTEMMT